MNGKKVKLSDAFDLQMGKTPSRGNTEYWDGNNSWVAISDLNDNQKYIQTTEEKITDKAVKESKIKIVPRNTVIMSFKLSIGKAAITLKDMYTNEAIMAFHDKGKYKILTDYIYYFCVCNDWTRGTNKAVKGLTLNKETLSDKYILIPSLDDQQKIVENLDAVNAAIANRQQNLTLLDELVKSRFIEMFGDPVVNNFHWTCKNLKDLSVKITNGTTPKGGSKVYVDEGILFLRSQNVWKNKIILDDVAHIDDVTNDSMNDSILKHNDILITKTGRFNTENSSLGRAALYDGEDGTANINGHVYLVRLKDSINPEFVVKILTSESYRTLIRNVCVGGIDKRQLNKNHIEDFPIIIPPLALQNKFAEFVHRVDDAKAAVEAQADALSVMRDKLMQDYFNRLDGSFSA